VTGLSYFSEEIIAKRLELLKELVPGFARVGVLRNPLVPGHPILWKETEVAAQRLGVALEPVEVRGPEDFEAAFATAKQRNSQAVLTWSHRAALAARPRRRGNRMKRRKFITLLGDAATWPLTARAQQPATPAIGFLSSRSSGESLGVVAAFREGLRETGFVEGRNLAIAFRWAEGHYERLPELAAELVSLPVALLFRGWWYAHCFRGQKCNLYNPDCFFRCR
jgi:hypothetical protein